MRKIALLGSTGSIGTQALDVAARHADRFQIVALTANTNTEKLFEQAPESRGDACRGGRRARFRRRLRRTARGDGRARRGQARAAGE